MSLPLTDYVTLHLLATVRAIPMLGTVLPGGFYKAVGPNDIPYPFGVYSYSSGADKLAFNTNPIAVNGGGLLYQIKVIDRGYDEAKAVSGYAAIVAALKGANNSGASGAYVSAQEETPVDIPVFERDQMFQQIGGVWRFWVDPIS